MEFDLFSFAFLIQVLVIMGFGAFMVTMFIKQMKDRKSEGALPFLVVQATLVEKRWTRMAGSGNMSHYATFEFENGDRHEFRVLHVVYSELVEGCFGQLTIQGTSFKKFERIG